ncbi:AtpZ/AtpI family protein [Anabaenopsis tanganyikae CS-531]|uniref:AtpZ/AtpI family protein n=2 Tax=Anabaenopsis TaxID=110103 RepID=A0ABT5ARR7_9CYAN|nr:MULTISPECIES: AtpZ/AtpI family protein [Anabaenopsis]MDB9539612.1 AtpZ/AtpI family protein [Anabaenopsis arnoldii]MDH6091917.1 AtpZ/AtpI family protein [Anabaenopsis arnoldii]MDH6107442.1 AtpZ/AtpI family protein [Anabaenopsis tanganyikae CS-531]
MKHPHKSLPKKRHKSDREFQQQIKSKLARKLAAQRQKDESIWFNLGMIGLVGWSITIPTLLGIALGIWIDKTSTSQYSWTLMMLFIGLILGCLNAWFWVQQQSTNQ